MRDDEEAGRERKQLIQAAAEVSRGRRSFSTVSRWRRPFSGRSLERSSQSWKLKRKTKIEKEKNLFCCLGCCVICKIKEQLIQCDYISKFVEILFCFSIRPPTPTHIFPIITLPLHFCQLVGGNLFFQC